jgi:hypothetical protein
MMQVTVVCSEQPALECVGNGMHGKRECERGVCTCGVWSARAGRKGPGSLHVHVGYGDVVR